MTHLLPSLKRSDAEGVGPEWDQWAAWVEGERTQNGNRYQDTLLGGPLLEKEYKKKSLTRD